TGHPPGRRSPRRRRGVPAEASAPDVSRGARPGTPFPVPLRRAQRPLPLPSAPLRAARRAAGRGRPVPAPPLPYCAPERPPCPAGPGGTGGGSGNRLPVPGPSFRAPPSRSVPGGLQAEADLQPHLVVGDLPVLQVAAHLG